MRKSMPSGAGMVYKSKQVKLVMIVSLYHFVARRHTMYICMLHVHVYVKWCICLPNLIKLFCAVVCFFIWLTGCYCRLWCFQYISESDTWFVDVGYSLYIPSYLLDRFFELFMVHVPRKPQNITVWDNLYFISFGLTKTVFYRGPKITSVYMSFTFSEWFFFWTGFFV